MTELIVPASGRALFSPGGRHLMLKGARQPVITGQLVEMTLVFESGREQTVPVKAAVR